MIAPLLCQKCQYPEPPRCLSSSIREIPGKKTQPLRHAVDRERWKKRIKAKSRYPVFRCAQMASLFAPLLLMPSGDHCPHGSADLSPLPPEMVFSFGTHPNPIVVSLKSSSLPYSLSASPIDILQLYYRKGMVLFESISASNKLERSCSFSDSLVCAAFPFFH